MAEIEFFFQATLFNTCRTVVNIFDKFCTIPNAMVYDDGLPRFKIQRMHQNRKN